MLERAVAADGFNSPEGLLSFTLGVTVSTDYPVEDGGMNDVLIQSRRPTSTSFLKCCLKCSLLQSFNSAGQGRGSHFVFSVFLNEKPFGVQRWCLKTKIKLTSDKRQ